jgi:hypothetical protein
MISYRTSHAETVILEIQAVPALLPAHEALVLTYLSGLQVRLLMNLHPTRLKDDLKRFVVI